MERIALPSDKISPEARDAASKHRELVEEVAGVVARDRVVVVGMAQNPHVRKARKLLDAAGVKFTYLEYGSYFSAWQRRLALKIWAGFPTFPMVFVDGVLVGGAAQLGELLSAGKLAP